MSSSRVLNSLESQPHSYEKFTHLHTSNILFRDTVETKANIIIINIYTKKNVHCNEYTYTEMCLDV